MHFLHLQRSPRTATSNPNALQSQKLLHYLDQGRTLNDM